MERMTTLSSHLSQSPLQLRDTPQALVLTLNRPRVLNALSYEILGELHSALPSLGPRTLILQGAGKAFCAGGDVVFLCNNPQECPNFFQKEFSLLCRLHRRPNFTVAIMKGPTMGGGAGLSAACKVRVATTSTLWAFPETAIGFVPDVGANFLLPRLASKAAGLYLALTGERLNGADCFYLGIATHYVEEARLEELTEALATSFDPGATLAGFHTVPDRSLCSLLQLIPAIEGTFSNVTTIEELFSRLSQNDTEWAQKTLSTLNFLCPLSLKVELVLIELGSTMTYEEVLDQEYDVNIRMTAVNNVNFLTGVRHRLIQKEKTRAPWTPASISEVTEDLVASCLANEAGPRLNTKGISE